METQPETVQCYVTEAELHVSLAVVVESEELFVITSIHNKSSQLNLKR